MKVWSRFKIEGADDCLPIGVVGTGKSSVDYINDIHVRNIALGLKGRSVVLANETEQLAVELDGYFINGHKVKAWDLGFDEKGYCRFKYKGEIMKDILNEYVVIFVIDEEGNALDLGLEYLKINLGRMKI